MKLKEKLARLSAPVNRGAGASAGRSASVRGSGVSASGHTSASSRVPFGAEQQQPTMEALAANARATQTYDSRADAHGAPDAAPHPAGADIHAGCEPEPANEPDGARAERISRLRGLIGDVLARGRSRFGDSVSSHFAEPATARVREGARTISSPSRSREALEAAIAAAQRASESIGAAGDAGESPWSDPDLPELAHASAAPLALAAVADISHAVDPGRRVAMLRQTFDGWIPARARLARVFAEQPWATRETPHGPLFLVERWLEPAHLHGRAAVHSALERLPATLAALALDPQLAGLDLSHMLFLDTETTGLMVGSGTVAFLVGVAAFHDDSLLLTQLVLPNLGGEVPMLTALAEHLAAASCILTYNGKSFDWPLLRTRYVMNRLPVPALPPHVDLLHACRRIWKPRLGSVRLQDVEREIMHFSREGDVDGAEIPSRYFSFLRDGGTEGLVPVLEHNQNDLIALPAMLGALGERFERIECGDHALDALAFGRLALRVADRDRAAAFAHVAIAASEGSDLESHAWSFRGEVAKRAREAEDAVRHYEQALLLSSDPLRSATLRVLLSKLYEHGVRDLRSAYRHARETELAEGPQLQGRRLGRLTRKLERESEKRAIRKRTRLPSTRRRSASETSALAMHAAAVGAGEDACS